MKKLFLMIILVVTSFAMAGTKAANYAGSWELDFKQSKNLPAFYENVKSHRLIITQDAKQLNVAVEIDLGQSEPDKMNFVYNLDGTETKTEAKIRTPNGPVIVPATLKAISAGGENLQITISREIPMGESTFKGVTTEEWKLNADGKILTIDRADETPRGKRQAEMVFVKE